MFAVGEKPLAVDGTVEHAGRVDAVVAQRSQECRRLPMAVRDLGDEPYVGAGATNRRGRVMLVLVQVSSMNTSREGSTRFPDGFASACDGALCPHDSCSRAISVFF